MNLDEATVREQLKGIRTALKKNEDEHDVLVTLFNGYEGWLRLYARNGNAPPQLPLTLTSPQPRAQKDGPSNRKLIMEVLKEARGASLHVREIWMRVQARGGVSHAKNILSIVDLTCSNLLLRKHESIEKTASRTWRWTGDAELTMNGSIATGIIPAHSTSG